MVVSSQVFWKKSHTQQFPQLTRRGVNDEKSAMGFLLARLGSERVGLVGVCAPCLCGTV